MNINANVGLRDRSRITLGGFKGLDTLSAAVDVSAIHATEMKNLISRDGVNHKRFGWKTQYRIREDGRFLKIQGFFDLTLFGEKFLIAYADKRFWLVDLEQYTHVDITNNALSSAKEITQHNTIVSPVNKDFLLDTECKCYINGNKAYFIGCGDFLVFSKWDNDRFELRRVMGNEDVYIPITTENIGSKEYGQHYTRITAEERNLLSPYTYNLLMGVDTLSRNSVATYYLDCKGFSDLELYVETPKDTKHLKREKGYPELMGGNSVKNIELHAGIKKEYRKTIYKNYKNEAECRLTIDDVYKYFELLKFSDGSSLGIKNEIIAINTHADKGITFYIPKVSSKLVYVKEDKEEVIADWKALRAGWSIDSFTEDISKTRITISGYYMIDFNPINIDLTNYNLIIEEIINGKHYNIDSFIIKDGEYVADVYPLDGMLVIKGIEDEAAYEPLSSDVPSIRAKIKTNNLTIIPDFRVACEFGAQGGTDRLFIVDNTGNTVRWSKDEDFTYIGEKAWCVCGTSDKSITGMDRLNDSTLLIVKEYSLREPSIFIITGNILAGETEAGTVDYTALFTPRGYQVGMGAVGEIVNFNGDCIMVGKDGLYAVSLGENMTVDSRYVLHRSRQISNKLEKFDLANAKCVSFNGKFFVAVGGEEQECYVADNKYTASFQGDIQNVVNYEWWRWTNIPVNVWGFVGNELWFGTNDGQLCSFTENFYDQTLTWFPAGKGLIYYDCGDNDDACECGDIIGFGFVPDIKFQKGDVFTPTCDFYGGIKTNKFECVDGETKFYLPLNDYLDGEEIYIDNKAYKITKHDLYFSIAFTTQLTELTIYKNYKYKPLTVMDDVVMVLKDSAGYFPTWSKTSLTGGLNPSIGDFTATLSHKEPVVAKWLSGAMDLGTRAYSKSLTYLVLTGEKDLANRLKYGLKTRFTHRDYELLRANNDLDFTELDLQTVSMDSDFASSYTKKLNIRNINFLMFYFESDTAEDVALNSIQIEFKLCKRNIGVR